MLLGNPDILQPDILNAGGPGEVKRIYEMATVLDKPVMPHSPQAGINSMASLHVYATVQNATRPHEFSTEFSGPLDDVARPVLPVASSCPENVASEHQKAPATTCSLASNSCGPAVTRADRTRYSRDVQAS